MRQGEGIQGHHTLFFFSMRTTKSTKFSFHAIKNHTLHHASVPQTFRTCLGLYKYKVALMTVMGGIVSGCWPAREDNKCNLRHVEEACVDVL